MNILMKIILSIIALLLTASLATAHEGMIAFFSDQTTSGCQEILTEFQVIKLPLFYIRGDGPRFGQVCEFRISKSSSGITLGMPEFSPSHGLVITFGNPESGITIGYHVGETWCAPDEDVFFMGVIPVANLSDPDTFTVSVVEHTVCIPTCGIRIVPCGTNDPVNVIGGTFVFNGDCYTPEDPFRNPTGVESLSWGAIKSILR